ncbi:MAG: hypothetical protein R6X06_12650, partial [Gammaproteobacteria bacterium]
EDAEKIRLKIFAFFAPSRCDLLNLKSRSPQRRRGRREDQIENLCVLCAFALRSFESQEPFTVKA